MFLKLCKYELKRSYKAFLLYYVILLCSSFSVFKSPYGMQLLVMFIAGLLAVTVGVLIVIGIDFYQTMYGREAYLTHTLPVSSTELILSKFLIAAFWVLISMIVCAISCYLFIKDICVISFTDFFNMKLLCLMGLEFIIFLLEIGLNFAIISLCHTTMKTKHKKFWMILYCISFSDIAFKLFSKDPIFTNILMNTAYGNQGKNYVFNYQIQAETMYIFIILSFIGIFLIITKLCIDRKMEI